MNRQEALFKKQCEWRAEVNEIKNRQERESKQILRELMPTLKSISWDFSSEYNDEGGTYNTIIDIELHLLDGAEIQLGNMYGIEDGFDAEEAGVFCKENGLPEDTDIKKFFYSKGLIETADDDDLDYLCAVIHGMLEVYEAEGVEASLDL